MKITDIATNLKLREEYLKWCNDPMTQLVVDLLRMEGRMEIPHRDCVTGEHALLAQGMNIGYHAALDHALNIACNDQKPGEEPTANYGASELLRTMYPGAKLKPETKGTSNA